MCLPCFLSRLINHDVSTGCIRLLHSFNLIFQDISLDLKSLICAKYMQFAVIILERMPTHILFSLFISDLKYVKLSKPSGLKSLKFTWGVPKLKAHILTFILLEFSTWFMRNVLLEEKMIKLLNEQHFVENKTEVMHHV